MLQIVRKYQINDLTAKTESWTADILIAMATIDYLNQILKHDVEMVDTETGARFYWRGRGVFNHYHGSFN